MSPQAVTPLSTATNTQAQWLRKQGSIPGKSRTFLSSLHCPHQLWSSNQRDFFKVKQPEHEVGQSPYFFQQG